MNKVKLGEILKIKHGFAFKSENYVDESEYALVTLANISSTNNFQFNKDKTTFYGASFPNDFILKEDDLIMPLTEQVVGLFGNTAFVPKMQGITFVLNQRIGKVVPVDDKADKYYLHYLLATNLVKDQLEYRASGTRQRNISPDDVYDVEVFLPDITTQRKIGKCLYDIEKKVNLNNAINDNLAYQLKDIYNYWFNQFDFPHNDKHQYKADGGLMIWNDKIKRKIPAGWEIKSFGELCSLRNGINYDKSVEGDKIYRIINVRNISSSDLILNENDLDEISLPQKQGNKYCVSENSIIVARSGIPGATRILQKPSSNIIFCGFIICCTPCDDIYKYYLMFYLKQLEGSAATKTGGSILQNVSQDTLSNLTVPIPPQSLLREFNQIVSQSLELIHSNMQENTQLLKLRDWLLPMLMNGQATISD